ncbi:MAG: (2Fe-2S) ferredoxin domain-containing protein [Erysipelotrichaceae bacterium]|nr:(2Fe-2S) ferredoxin domain-containing protein [Erysipelotrichaceae bacterium]
MTVLICVGSSCHLKGSYDIIELMKARLAKEGLEDKVNLKGTFCLGKCGIAGVSIQVDEQIITGVTKDNFDDVFNKHILSKVRG